MVWIHFPFTCMPLANERFSSEVAHWLTLVR